jgi:hypothetical protein
MVLLRKKQSPPQGLKWRTLVSSLQIRSSDAMLLSNARNVVRVEDGVVVKRSADLAGELFFYRELALRVPRLRRLFPRLLPGSSTARLELELVPATPLTRVFAGLRMRPRHLSAVFAALGELHAVGEAEVALTTSPAAAKLFLAEKTAARVGWVSSSGCRATSPATDSSCTASHTSPISCPSCHTYGEGWCGEGRER